MIELPEKTQAEFDEGFAASVEMFTELLASYICRRAEDEADGWPEPVTVMSLTNSLAEHWDNAQLVSALAVAVVLVAEHMGQAHGPLG